MYGDIQNILKGGSEQREQTQSNFEQYHLNDVEDARSERVSVAEAPIRQDSDQYNGKIAVLTETNNRLK